jgi:glycerol-3-phosphate dehydrogenase
MMMESKPTSHLIAQERDQRLARLSAEQFDVLIVGGGITGAAIARHAACSGLRVALVEQGDFASGTSSRSSRMIHGGLRYLKNGQLRLVYDSLREQQRLAEIAPHLVRPLRMLIPLYQRSFINRCAHYGGMSLYKAMQPHGKGARHENLSARELLKLEPLLFAENLQGGFVCHEYLTHDARLVWETVLAASEAGACVLNYARVEELMTSRERVAGALIRDILTGQLVEVNARISVNAAGPWSDRLAREFPNQRRRLRLTKGVHIILPRRCLPLSHAVVLTSPKDARSMVAIPTENLLIIGPTETDFDGRPEDVSPATADVEYLIESLESLFAHSNIGPEDVVASRAGLRPLYDQPARDAGEVSRAYHIEWQRAGLLSVLGGKLTLHRRAAAKALRFISRELGHRQARKSARDTCGPLPGAVWTNSTHALTGVLEEAGLAEDSIKHLVQTYGSRAALIADMLAEEPSWRRRIAQGLPHILAEVPFAIRYEMATCARDFTERRSDLALRARADGVALAPELDQFWHDASEAEREVACALTTQKTGLPT